MKFGLKVGVVYNELGAFMSKILESKIELEPKAPSGSLFLGKYSIPVSPGTVPFDPRLQPTKPEESSEQFMKAIKEGANKGVFPPLPDEFREEKT